MDNLNELIGTRVTMEQLQGRNFFHYTNGVKDNPQPLVLELGDMGVEFDGKSIKNKSLKGWVSDACWVKRYPTTEDECCTQAYILIILEVNDEDVVTYCHSILEYHNDNGFMMDSMDNSMGEVFFDRNDYIPERILEDLNYLKLGRHIPNHFTLIHKQLPKKIIQENGYETPHKTCTLALNSAFRLAYGHITIYLKPQKIIESIEYESYESSGGFWEDMFSRPGDVENCKEEFMEMILYIIDHYTTAEYIKNM